MQDRVYRHHTANYVNINSIIDHHEAENECEEVATKARLSRQRTRKKIGKDRSPSKIPQTKAQNSNLLLKPKNDDSSESSSIKDSGYEEPENDGITKNNKRSSDSKKKIKPDKGSSGTVTSYLKTEKQEDFSA